MKFSKMHGAGNDFIVVDDSAENCFRAPSFISLLCDRRRGIGADGLISISRIEGDFVSNASSADMRLRMDFFNSDGRMADTCGNGLRCAALFAAKHMNAGKKVLFETGAGESLAEVLADSKIRVEIPLIKEPERMTLDGFECFFVNTGVPHLVVKVEDLTNFDVKGIGRVLRNNSRLAPEGANVDFVEFSVELNNLASIRTFERGVEDETLACGTGAAAAAVCAVSFLNKRSPLDFKTAGGDVLAIDFSLEEGIVSTESRLSLTGPAVEVCSGVLSGGFRESS
ncbi:MAG: diaminopimelate epimerase [Kiritimatiellaeota bacterium]|nr:diaminopimelate epimerase [Kiritimatiellota bacterium]